MNPRDFIARIAQQFSGTPYLWGGAGARRNGEFGFDCSGFAIFLLKPCGLLPRKGDWTARQLFGMFEETDTAEPGDLVFYGPEESKINHVMVYLGAGQCVGAAGGTSKTTTVKLARRSKAEVKIVAVKYRKDLVGFCNVLAPKSKVGGSGR